MAIKWLEEDAAEKLFTATFEKWRTNAEIGYHGCHSAKETEEYVRSFLSAGFSESPTAKAIMQYVEVSPKTICVVGMRGGYQCFDSTAGEQKDHQVVYIDVDGKLEIFVRSPHGMQIRFGTKPQAPSRDAHRVLMLHPNTLKSAAAHTSVIIKRVSLDNRIAALHEFGHAKQWLERPNLFDAQMREAGNADDAESLARRFLTEPSLDRYRKIDWEKRAAALRGVSAQPGGEQADPRLSQVSFARDINGAAAKRVTTSTREIEMDNMSRHEWPICREIGLPYRSNCRDPVGTTTAEASMTSQILLKARALEHH